MSKDRGANILAAIQQMAMDNNQGLRMTTTLVNVTEDQRGSIVGFGTEKEMSETPSSKSDRHARRVIWHVRSS